ncbi:interleukin-27 receptor subunit alpha [Monodelphis domestica]|uniref:interleukin-27 receptor subunit alpha n=1 Tax=Monodelphis domestica TaxID=13616 RepID=UPI0024E26259|nr:interleukin-27 receptor subunit alpha [Monodelphis domestica]
MNCTWGLSLDPGIPYNFYYQSLKYHPNRIQNVSVSRGQGWVMVEREHLTISDHYLIWLSPMGNISQPGDPEPLRLCLDDIVKPEPPKLFPVEFSDDPRAVTVTWNTPAWPPHESFECQLRFRNILASVWQQVEPKDLTSSFLELRGLEPATGYEMSSRCQLQNSMGFWSDWSSTLKFQTLPVAPTSLVDMWVLGSPCRSSRPKEESYVLLWKVTWDLEAVSQLGITETVLRVDLMPGSGLNYTVVFQGPGRDWHPKVIPCCNAILPNGTERNELQLLYCVGNWGTKLPGLYLSPGSAPKSVQVNSMGNQGILVKWVPEPQEYQEFVVEWTQEDSSLQELNWTRLPTGSQSTLLRGNFEKGVPYCVTVSGVSPKGLAFAPPVWGYSQEIEPLEGPALWQLPDAASGALTVAWAELPRGQRGGHLTHYTLYVQQDSGSLTLHNGNPLPPSSASPYVGSLFQDWLPLAFGDLQVSPLWLILELATQGTSSLSHMSIPFTLPSAVSSDHIFSVSLVSADVLNVTLLDLPEGHYKMWMTASTIAGPGQPGPSLQLYLPEKYSEKWKVLLVVLLLCGLLLLSCCLGLAFSKCCLQLCHKLLPHWVSERIPDPSNSKSMQPWGEELPPAPPPKDALFIEVEEVQIMMSPAPQAPETPIPLDSGYEKHFLPTPEELGLVTLLRPQTST